jgi:hypothetical protein
MTHYDTSRWIAFVRGFGSEAARAPLEQHLADGCPDCWQVVSRLRVFSAIVRNEAQCEVAPRALKFARSLGARLPKKPWLLSRMMSRLVFDTMQAPLMAGVRGEAQASRQALYQAGDYSLDLRLEQEGSYASVTLVGQVASAQMPAAELSNLPVAIVSRGTVLVQTVSNGLGEFHVEVPPEPDLTLFIQVNPERSIEASLDQFCENGPRRGAGG